MFLIGSVIVNIVYRNQNTAYMMYALKLCLLHPVCISWDFQSWGSCISFLPKWHV